MSEKPSESEEQKKYLDEDDRDRLERSQKRHDKQSQPLQHQPFSRALGQLKPSESLHFQGGQKTHMSEPLKK